MSETSVDHDDLSERMLDFHISHPGWEEAHALFGELRDRCPVARSEGSGGFWVLSRYDDINRALKDPAFSTRYVSIPADDHHARLIPLGFDPPDHTLYRQQFTSWFSPGSVAKIEPALRAQAASLLEAFTAKCGGDFIADFCVPFPCISFLALVGWPVSDLDRLLRWKDYLIRDDLSDSDEKRAYVRDVVQPEFRSYLTAALEARASMADPPEDPLTAIVRGKFGDRPLSLDEQLNVLTLFFMAGLDTTTGVLGFIGHFLATHPEHWKQLQDDPSLIPGAVEEFLRYFSIVSPARVLVEDVTIHGVELKAGDMVQLPTPSAARDSAQFEHPEEVDFRRDPNRHLGLGAGPHRCLGSHLARLELRVALEEMIAIMPTFGVDPGSAVESHFGVLAGIDVLPLVLEANV